MENWTMQRIRRLSKRDILDAFKIVAYEVRSKCKRFASGTLTQAEACAIALRIRDQRELVRQMVARGAIKHVRCLLRLNSQYRKDLLRMVKQARLDPNILVFK